MARVMSTQKLWRALRQAGRPPAQSDEPLVPGAVLGSWAAKVFSVDQRDLVLALNERTCLTVVFPLASREEFGRRFSDAVRTALQDLGVPQHNSFLESAAVAVEPLTRLTNLDLGAILDDLQFFCEIELGYHSDLRTVQLNLNQVPHPGLDPCVPADAVARLFAGPPDGDPVLNH